MRRHKAGLSTEDLPSLKSLFLVLLRLGFLLLPSADTFTWAWIDVIEACSLAGRDEVIRRHPTRPENMEEGS